MKFQKDGLELKKELNNVTPNIMQNIFSKLPDIGPSIFTTMSQLAVENNAINLGQGFPNYAMDKHLISLVNNAMLAGENQYVHSNGHPLLRERIAEKIKDLYNTSINPQTEITITPGGTYAIYNALTTILQPQDEVIIFEPAYDCYAPTIELCGAKLVPIALTYPSYQIDWNLVKEKINSKTKLIIINSPHNPTGSILSATDLETLSELVAATKIFILSDEVYEHLIFNHKKHESILKYPALLHRSFVCFSFGKVFNCTGWKLGYCIAPQYLMQEFQKIHQYNCFTCNTPMQVALSKFLEFKDHYLLLGSIMQQKKDYLESLMKDTKLIPLPSFGTYFQLYSYAEVSTENEIDFAKKLVQKCGVATIPVSSFYRNNTNNQVLRFCFCKTNDVLEEAANRIQKMQF